MADGAHRHNPSSTTHPTGGVPDDELVARAVTGNRDAFAMLINRHYDRIYRLAYGWSGDQAAAEDATQDVVVKLATAITKFEGRSQFTTWLHRLVMNHLHDKARAKKRRRIDPGVVFEDLQIAAEDVPADRQAAASQAMKAVNALPQKLREAVILVYWQGLTHEAAGAVLGCKGGTVSWRLNEAKTRLAKTLDWYEPKQGARRS
ncbi:MAG: RNA polymerase sigma factor [Pseudomonadota bacterium]